MLYIVFPQVLISNVLGSVLHEKHIARRSNSQRNLYKGVLTGIAWGQPDFVVGKVHYETKVGRAVLQFLSVNVRKNGRKWTWDSPCDPAARPAHPAPSAQSFHRTVAVPAVSGYRNCRWPVCGAGLDRGQ